MVAAVEPPAGGAENGGDGRGRTLRIFEAAARLGDMNRATAELVTPLAKETAEAVSGWAPAR